MWLAKPLSLLSPAEQAAWCGVLDRFRENGREAPLAQSLAWGRAIQAVGGQVYVVFSPEESVGGLVFATLPEGNTRPKFECINGPLLDWEHPERIKQQLALFATAVSRLDPRFSALVLRPRWLKGEAAKRLTGLPLEPSRTALASTLKLPLHPEFNAEDSFSSRLLRTLRASDRAGITAQWQELDSANLVEFAVATQAFGQVRGFTVPPIFWFRALTQKSQVSEKLRFGLVTAGVPQASAGCQLLVAHHAGEAHYLFGHQWRTADSRAALSPSAAAHRLAIRHAALAGMSAYDFNGFMDDIAPEHPYSGVSQFKAQFGAGLVEYEVPEFTIAP